MPEARAIAVAGTRASVGSSMSLIAGPMHEPGLELGTIECFNGVEDDARVAPLERCSGVLDSLQITLEHFHDSGIGGLSGSRRSGDQPFDLAWLDEQASQAFAFWRRLTAWKRGRSFKPPSRVGSRITGVGELPRCLRQISCLCGRSPTGSRIRSWRTRTFRRGR